MSAMDFVKSPIENYRTRHIDVKLFFVRNLLSNNLFELIYVPSKENLADALTKALTRRELEIFFSSNFD